MKNGAPINAIGGSIKVRVDTKINGEDKTLEIPVHMFAVELTNNGTPNPAYESITRIKTNMSLSPHRITTTQIVFALLAAPFR